MVGKEVSGGGKFHDESWSNTLARSLEPTTCEASSLNEPLFVVRRYIILLCDIASRDAL